MICDFRLPDANGLDVAEMVRRCFPCIKPIILTGEVLDERLKIASSDGIRVIYKPVDAATLLSIVGES